MSCDIGIVYLMLKQVNKYSQQWEKILVIKEFQIILCMPAVDSRAKKPKGNIILKRSLRDFGDLLWLA
jgi:hypothetical protein